VDLIPGGAQLRAKTVTEGISGDADDGTEATSGGGDRSTGTGSDDPGDVSVLVVEDEPDLADMYAAYLDEYDTEVVYGGEEALDALGAGGYDLVLLDRRMPIVSGNEVLAFIEEQGLDCRVAMVTAVNPDFDIIDLRIDDYVVKPVTREKLRETVSRLVTLDEYNERMQRLTAKKLKRNVLQVEKTRAALQDSEEFRQLAAEIDQLESEVDSLAEELDLDDR
jgi:DNA-binding response OmpR family regulator